VALPGVLNGRQFVSGAADGRSAWLFSWPLLVGIGAYLYALHNASELLQDGDVFWHVASGQWILRHGTVPSVDPFSHTVAGAAWTTHEWLSAVLLAALHDAGGWPLVVCGTGLAFAATITMLTRALLSWLEPIYALMFALLAIPMTSGHLLARPHIIALPLLMLWTIQLVHACEAQRSPPRWLLAVMVAWANMHGSFTLGLGLTAAIGVEAALTAERGKRVTLARTWGLFMALSVGAALITPNGVQGIYFTYHLLFELTYMLQFINEWRSPSFETFNVFELWLLGALALALYQGLRLPPMRLILLVGLLHLGLKHVRYVELVGLLAPLFVASPLAVQWAHRRQTRGGQQVEPVDRFFARLAQPAGRSAIIAGVLAIVLASSLASRVRPIKLSEMVAPVKALEAVRQAGIAGPVLNSYSTGGYLIYQGIPVFIDGRADIYGDAFLKTYVEALGLKETGGLEKLLDKHRIAWTLLESGSAAATLLDHLPGWRRLYADSNVVIHMRTTPAPASESESTMRDRAGSTR
jgi:hypothetical protein